MTIQTKMLGSLIAILLMINIFQEKTVRVLKDKVVKAQKAANEASAEAFGDCRRIMQSQNSLLKLNTCYQVVEMLCSGQSKCVRSWQEMCQNEEYEQ